MSEHVEVEVVEVFRHPGNAAIRDASDITDVQRSAAQAALKHHLEAEAHLRAWSENVVFCGLHLLALKKELKHGDWLEFLSRFLPDISERHARNYMQVASSVEARMNKKLVGRDLDEAQREKLSRVIQKTTDATSWRGLFADLGIGVAKPKQGLGGAHAKRNEAEEPEGDATEQAKRMTYWETLSESVRALRRDVLEHKHHVYVDYETRTNLADALADVIKELRK